MYQISSELYVEIVENLFNQLEGRGYYSGSFSFEYCGITCRMVLSAIVHYEPKDVSGGSVGGVKDVVPVWWEFHTEAEDGEMLNDFSFNELRKIIKCY